MSDSTLMSSKGQIVLPKTLRIRRGWGPGMRLTVTETQEGVLLKPAKAVNAGKLAEVAGSLRRKGSARSIEEMEIGIAQAVKRRHARG